MLMICNKCKRVLSIEAFYTHNFRQCRECHKEYRRNRPTQRASTSRNQAIRRGSLEETAELVLYDKVYERDKGICWICEELTTFQEGELDHVIPCKFGGPHTYDNIRLAHLRCNRQSWRRF